MTMRRVAPAIPIPPQVFKHFAVLTLAITTCVAIFADGESTEAIAAQVQSRQAKNELLATEVTKVGPRHVSAAKLTLHNDKRAYMPFAADAPDDSGGFGAPMDTAGGADPGSGGDASTGPAAALANAIGPGPGQFSPQGRPGDQRPPKPTPQQLNKLLEASRLRSGG